MVNCLQNEGQLILHSRTGSLYMRYSPGDHNLTQASDLFCRPYITSVPSDRHIAIEILAESTECGFSVIATDYTTYGWVSYCYVTAREDMTTSKKWIISSDLVELRVRIYRLTMPFVFHLRFKPVQPSYELQLHYDSPNRGK